jgi:hypothetical protein
MKLAALVAIVTLGSSALAAAQEQERKVPKDSARVSIAGCAHNRTFIVARPPEGEPVRSDIAEGRRFKLNAKKELLADIKAHESDLIEVTGLILKADLTPESGVSLGGGRVRIGPGNPQAPLGGTGGTSNVATDPRYNEAQIDVESWRRLPASCPAK